MFQLRLIPLLLLVGACGVEVPVVEQYHPPYKLGADCPDVTGIVIDEGDGFVMVYDTATGSVYRCNTYAR